MFIEKVVSGWSGQTDIDHVEIVASFLRRVKSSQGSTTSTSSSSTFSDIKGYNVLQVTKTTRDGKDPLYAIVATKS